MKNIENKDFKDIAISCLWKLLGVVALLPVIYYMIKYFFIFLGYLLYTPITWFNNPDYIWIVFTIANLLLAILFANVALYKDCKIYKPSSCNALLLTNSILYITKTYLFIGFVEGVKNLEDGNGFLSNDWGYFYFIVFSVFIVSELVFWAFVSSDNEDGDKDGDAESEEKTEV